MQLYLVQHGAAKSEAEDPQRSLTDEGARSVEAMADFVAAMGVRLDVIEHSDKLRACQTAEIVATRLNPAKGTKQVPGIAPNDDVGLMVERLQKEPKNTMLIGHLPYLGRLMARLLRIEADYAPVRFQMGGIVAMDRDDAGNWQICWMLVPELFRTRSERGRRAA